MPLWLNVPCYKLYFIGCMLPSRMRNYSVKSLYPRTERRTEDEKGRGDDAKGRTDEGKGRILLPTIAEARDMQKLQAELGINIKRFQNMAQKGENNGDQIVRAAFFVLTSFSEVDNNFRDVFQELQAHLRPYLFLSDLELALKYRLKEGVTLSKAIKAVERTNKQWLQERDKKIEELLGLVALREKEGRNEADRLGFECHKLREEVEMYKKLANVEYVRSLERKVQSLKETVSSQEEDYKVLAKKNEESSLQIEQLRREVAELQVVNSQLQQKVYDLSVIRERSELYLLRTKDRFDQLHNRMEGMKEVIAKVEKENETLVAERMQLVNRAAVAFEDLTPRPKYHEYFLLDNNTHLNATSQIMASLLEIQQGSRELIFEKYFLAKKNRKLMEVEAIRQKTARDIQQAKAEISTIK